MKTIIAKQLRKPSGFLGFLTGKALAKQNGFTYQAIERYLDFSKIARAFEIGYGPGAGVRYFSDKYGIRIDGVDFSQGMHRAATRRNKVGVRNGAINLRFGDFLTMDNPGARYDCVYFANVTYFWDDLREPFAKIRDIVNENGKLAFYMTNDSFLERYPVTQTSVFNKYSHEYVTQVLRDTGFKDVRHHRVFEDTDDFLIIEATK
jgi:SAM-dependent methyltransferase